MSPEEDNECWRLDFKSLMLGIALGSFFMYVALNGGSR